MARRLNSALRGAVSAAVTNAFYEPLSWQWPNWAKLFFNNKGVAAHTTDVCAQYPSDDQGVWNW